MLESVRNCQQCGLCKHQPPLIDNVGTCQVFWVGLSAKLLGDKLEGPLSPSTHSGSILEMVEQMAGGIPTYRTNLVKCAPLDKTGRLRYPNKKEISDCLPNLEEELSELSPKVVFLLGKQVADAIGKRFSVLFDPWAEYNYTFTKYQNIYFVPVHHPSYVYTYRRKQVGEYVQSISNMMCKLLS